MSSIGVSAVINRLSTTPGITTGLIAARPDAGYVTGDWYMSTDEKKLYRWTGSAWVVILDGGGGGVPTLQAVTSAGNTTTNYILQQGAAILRHSLTSLANSILLLAVDNNSSALVTIDPNNRSLQILSNRTAASSILQYTVPGLNKSTALGFVTPTKTNVINTPDDSGTIALLEQFRAIRVVSSTYTTVYADYTILVDNSTGILDINLDESVAKNGQVYNIKLTSIGFDARVLPISGLIDGASVYILAAATGMSSVTVQFLATSPASGNWFIISNYML